MLLEFDKNAVASLLSSTCLNLACQSLGRVKLQLGIAFAQWSHLNLPILNLILHQLMH